MRRIFMFLCELGWDARAAAQLTPRPSNRRTKRARELPGHARVAAALAAGGALSEPAQQAAWRAAQAADAGLARKLRSAAAADPDWPRAKYLLGAGGVLCHKGKPVVPEPWRAAAVALAHDERRHLAPDATEAALRVGVAWPALRDDVAAALRACAGCRLRRESPRASSFESGPAPWHERLLLRLQAQPALAPRYVPAPPQVAVDCAAAGIDASAGKLPLRRIQRKRDQVGNLLAALAAVVRPGDTVVEFCGGSGYVALPAARAFPDCSFVLLDMKRPSLDIAEERIAAAGLRNVRVHHGLVQDWEGAFDVGVGLHACGEATDLILRQCLDHGAAFVLAPCCIGKLKASADGGARSAALRAHLSRKEFEVLARAADFGHGADGGTDAERSLRRRLCKAFLERDRLLCAQEAGYSTRAFVMAPPSATPKNDVLLGLPGARPFRVELGAEVDAAAAASRGWFGGAGTSRGSGRDRLSR